VDIWIKQKITVVLFKVIDIVLNVSIYTFCFGGNHILTLLYFISFLQKVNLTINAEMITVYARTPTALKNVEALKFS
jgi:hypothetical protein